MNGKSQEATGSSSSNSYKNNSNNSDNQNHLPEEEVEESKRIVMNDNDGNDSNAEQAVKDENNNEIVNDGEEVPGGADNVEVHKRVNAKEVAENIEKIEDSDDEFVRCIESCFDNGYWMIFSCLNLEELNQFTDDS